MISRVWRQEIKRLLEYAEEERKLNELKDGFADEKSDGYHDFTENNKNRVRQDQLDGAAK